MTTMTTPLSDTDLLALESAKVVDARGSACPGPLLEAKKAMNTVPIGQPSRSGRAIPPPRPTSGPGRQGRPHVPRRPCRARGTSALRRPPEVATRAGDAGPEGAAAMTTLAPERPRRRSGRSFRASSSSRPTTSPIRASTWPAART